MAKHSSSDKNKKEGGDKMKPFSIRLPPETIKQVKEKAGIVPVTTYLRTLVFMWVNGEIEVTDEDVKKYN